MANIPLANAHDVSMEAEIDNITEENPPKRQKVVTGSARQLNEQMRMTGKPYHGFEKRGNDAPSYKQSRPRPGRAMGPRCASRFCEKSSKRKCNDVSDDARENLFNKFWNDMDWNEKKLYIAGLVDAKDTKQKTKESGPSRRQTSFLYHLNINGDRVPVCQTMFLHTFDLSQGRVQYWKNKMTTKAAREEMPKREKKATEKQKIAEEFVQNLPKVPSHYCRLRTAKLYLLPEIRTKCEIYRAFNSWCAEKNVHPVPGRAVLNKELKKQNISLYVPKKDQCDTCIAFKEGNVSEESYQQHIQRKESARAEKLSDKNDGDDTHSVWTMDVQAVLISPKLNASALYYKTKLASHNFTMYNLKTKDVKCYYWHEAEGDLSANTFASCIRDALATVVADERIKTITLYSDGCGYQNRNSLLSNMLLDFATAHRVVITQKYLERGHTQMEVDSIHSSIETRLKNRAVYYPGNYVEVFHECRLEQPYVVKEITHEFFKDFTSIKYVDSIRPGRKPGDPQVHDLRVLKYVGNPEPRIEYKIEHGSEFAALPQRIKQPREPWEISQLFSQPLKIKKTKYEHLQQLKRVIPCIYHQFYDDLPHM